MGVLYSFLQADDDEKAQSIIEWLTEINRLPSPDFKLGRTPTYTELRQVLDKMEDYKVDYHVNERIWDAWVTAPNGESALLCHVGVDGHYTGDENVLSNFYWKNHVEVMLPIAQKLADICGTMIIMNDSDVEDLIFVFPEQTQ